MSRAGPVSLLRRGHGCIRHHAARLRLPTASGRVRLCSHVPTQRRFVVCGCLAVALGSHALPMSCVVEPQWTTCSHTCQCSCWCTHAAAMSPSVLPFAGCTMSGSSHHLCAAGTQQTAWRLVAAATLFVPLLVTLAQERRAWRQYMMAGAPAPVLVQRQASGGMAVHHAIHKPKSL